MIADAKPSLSFGLHVDLHHEFAVVARGRLKIAMLPRIGNQTGGHVFLFLHTDDFWRDYEAYRSRGVVFREEPREEQYGIVAVFEDLYGNRWDLMELKR